METKPLAVERTYNAPIQKVWKAITEKEQMKHWYFDVSAFKAEKGFKFEFWGESDGRKFLHLCEVLEVDEPNKLSYSWQYESYPGYSVVTFELFKETETRTRLRLTHSGIESFPQNDPDFAASSFQAGWNAIVGEMLPRFVETTVQDKS